MPGHDEVVHWNRNSGRDLHPLKNRAFPRHTITPSAQSALRSMDCVASLAMTMCESRRDKLTRRANQPNPVQPSPKKYSAFAVGQITATDSPIPSRSEGRSPSSRTLGRVAVDAAASARKVIAGRFAVSDRRRADDGADPPSLKLRRSGTKLVEVFGAGGRVRQNRVVLAPVAGVKSAEARQPNRA
jgi:hypothetical protein